MAAKKATPKSSAVKAAPKKAVTRKAAAAKAPVEKAPVEKAPKKAAAGVKKTVKKAAPAIKLSAAQENLLREIGGAGEAGVVASKKIQKSLDALQNRKLVKKGKKEGEFFKYHV